MIGWAWVERSVWALVVGNIVGSAVRTVVSHLLNDYHKLGMQEVGYFRIRPPVKPITVGQLADLGDEA